MLKRFYPLGFGLQCLKRDNSQTNAFFAVVKFFTRRCVLARHVEIATVKKKITPLFEKFFKRTFPVMDYSLR